MHRIYLLIIVFGIIWSGLAYAEGEDEIEERAKKGLVLVEPSVVAAEMTGEEYKLLSYRERRLGWGSTFSIGYSSYEPINYEPDFVPAQFTDIYSTPEMPLIELTVVVKKNFSMGSLGFEMGVGGYQNDSDDTELSDSSLTLIPIRVGAAFYLDNLTPEPIFVPYVAGGGYTIMYKEELNGGSSNNGNTQVAPYVHGGLALSLNWIDKRGAREAFQESGIENTFAYFELQKFIESGAESDGDFSNDISYAGGVRVEF